MRLLGQLLPFLLSPRERLGLEIESLVAAERRMAARIWRAQLDLSLLQARRHVYEDAVSSFQRKAP